MSFSDAWVFLDGPLVRARRPTHSAGEIATHTSTLEALSGVRHGAGTMLGAPRAPPGRELERDFWLACLEYPLCGAKPGCVDLPRWTSREYSTAIACASMIARMQARASLATARVVSRVQYMRYSARARSGKS